MMTSKIDSKKYGTRGSAAKPLTEEGIKLFRESAGVVMLDHLIELLGDARVCGDGAGRDAYVAWVPLAAILTVN
jgi:hypothetical protein